MPFYVERNVYPFKEEVIFMLNGTLTLQGKSEIYVERNCSPVTGSNICGSKLSKATEIYIFRVQPSMLSSQIYTACICFGILVILPNFGEEQEGDRVV